MASDGLGGLAKRWLKSRADALLTTNAGTATAAKRREREAREEFREQVSTDVAYTVFPGLRAAAERREQRVADAREQQLAELVARPRANVEFAVDGEVSGAWSGRLPCAVHTGDGLLAVELTALPDEPVSVGGQPLFSWRFVVPGFHGDGVYDLNAIAAEVEQSGASIEYTDYELVLGSPDDPYLWGPDLGAATVEVAENGRRLDVVLTMGSSGGTVAVSARIEQEVTEDREAAG